MDRIGKPLQSFYLYLDPHKEIHSRHVKTFWEVAEQMGGLMRSLAIVGYVMILFVGAPSQQLEVIQKKGRILQRVFDLR